MNASIADAPWLHWRQTEQLAAIFAHAGEELRFVGGCVRDTLLKRDVSEIDAATPARPERVIALLQNAGVRALPTGLSHGTVTALIHTHSIEITTLRQDVACDGRHAAVEYTDDWALDAARRDFTINALYAAPSGELFDYVEGLADIAPLRLRFIGNPRDRITEDGLRILRYFRFLAQLDVPQADTDALQACAAEAERIHHLSGERIAQEMRKLLSAPMLRASLVQKMEHARLLPPLLLPPPPPALERLLELEPDPHWLRRLSEWMRGHNIGPLAERWKLSHAERDALQLRISTTLPLPDMTEAEQKKLLRHVGREVFEDVTLSASAQFGPTPTYQAMLTLPDRWKIPAFPITGADLLARGYKQGPALGATLKRLEEWWEAEDYQPTKEDLLKGLESNHG